MKSEIILIILIILVFTLIFPFAYGSKSECNKRGGVMLKTPYEINYTCYDKSKLVVK